jgi:beta-galactosidase
MADSGLNTVQLWVKWAWVEPAPGQFRFEDYDRLVELADKNGLRVVLSTIAAIHPYWIHREVPDSEMIDNMGHRVISSNRGECHFGLTPGGCLDHPGVWERMAGFLTEVVTRYRSAPNLYGWDAWNELRWNVHADGLVCYCPHTLSRFRKWLAGTCGGLEGLNEAWQRRYTSWEDVRPGKMPRSPYTEMMAFQHFVTWRSNTHGQARYDLIKSLDPARAVTVHGGSPTVLTATGYPVATSLARGNDWVYADHMDGIGCSSFPLWQGIDDTDLAARIDCITSAARGKRIWLSELQGGRAAGGFAVHEPVPPAAQQRWIWTGLSGGVDTILFWCWRDEVFGRESAGFGLTGRDGHAEARLQAMAETGRILREHEGLFEAYKPDPPEVGLYFSPQTYYLHWTENDAQTPQQAIQGYARALIRNSIPYTLVEESHLEVLERIKVLFMPRAIVVDDVTADVLCGFVENGGTLVCESECGAYGRNGLYRYPEDRFTYRLTGVQEIGRRRLCGDHLTFALDGRSMRLPAKQWLTPYGTDKGRVLAMCEEDAIILDVPVGQGHVLLCGTYFGDAYYQGSALESATYEPFCQDFEQSVAEVVRYAGVELPVQVIEPVPSAGAHVHVKTGQSEELRVAFIFLHGTDSARLQFRPGTFKGRAREIIEGIEVELVESPDGQECQLAEMRWGVGVLVGMD